MKRLICKFILILICTLLVWFAISGVLIWNFGNQDQAKKSDCIIVLGAAAYGAKPSPVFEERIKHAITLYKNELAPIIIFTGGYGNGAAYAESEVGSAYAAARGVNKSSILIETTSRTTQENLIRAKALMDDSALKTAIIVSDPLHLKRASIMAKALDISAVTSPTPSSRFRSLKTKLQFLFREIYFFNHYLMKGE